MSRELSKHVRNTNSLTERAHKGTSLATLLANYHDGEAQLETSDTYLHVLRHVPHETVALACEWICERRTSDDFGSPKPGDVLKACKAVVSRQEAERQHGDFLKRMATEKTNAERDRRNAPELLRQIRLEPVPEEPAKRYWHQRRILWIERLAGEMPPADEHTLPRIFNGSGTEFDHIYQPLGSQLPGGLDGG